jgi:predicted ester cyclase
MSTEENKQFIRRYLEAISGKPKTEAISRLFVAEQPLIEHILAAETAFPLYRLDADEIVAEGDLVSVRGMIRGVHQGPFMGVPPTGNPVEFSIFITYKVQGGKIVDHWMLTDNVAVMQQIGMLPAPAAA